MKLVITHLGGGAVQPALIRVYPPGEATALSFLRSLGWSDALQTEYQSEHVAGTVPVRISAEHRGQYSVIDDEAASYRAVMSGRMLAETGKGTTRPAVGDWVTVHPDPDGVSLIERRLTRATELVRKAAGDRKKPQVVAANIDVVFVTTSFTGDFNVRRIERYLTAVWEGGATPVIVLTKLDLCDDSAPYIAELATIAPGVATAQVCALDRRGLDEVTAHLGPGRTGAFVGSSGVGKSTLVNALIGNEVQATGAVRESDSRGRHVTSHRELFVTDSGIIIDTPGMREMGLWAEADAVAATYEDIDAVAQQCKFRNCAHEAEPGCALRRALDAGEVDAIRVEAYKKLGTEVAHLERKRTAAGRFEIREKGRRFGRMIKQAKRLKDDNK